MCLCSLENEIFQVPDLEGPVSEFHGNHFDVDNTSNAEMVLLDIMPEALTADTPILDTTIDCFMACACSVHGVVVVNVDCIRWSQDGAVSSVPAVSHYLLSRRQLLLQLVAKNLEIRPRATLKRTSKSYNLGCFNADSNLIAQSSRTKLVRVPLPVKGNGLFDQEVHTIDSDKGALTVMAFKSVIPDDLKGKMPLAMEQE